MLVPTANCVWKFGFVNEREIKVGSVSGSDEVHVIELVPFPTTLKFVIVIVACANAEKARREATEFLREKNMVEDDV